MNWIDEEVAVPSPSTSLVESGSELQLSGPPNQSRPFEEDQPASQNEVIKTFTVPSMMASLVQWICEVLDCAENHGQSRTMASLFELKESWEVVSWPRPKSANWNELMKCWLAEYHGQPPWIEYLNKVEELSTGQVQGPACLLFNEVMNMVAVQSSSTSQDDSSDEVTIIRAFQPKSAL